MRPTTLFETFASSSPPSWRNPPPFFHRDRDGKFHPILETNISIDSIVMSEIRLRVRYFFPIEAKRLSHSLDPSSLSYALMLQIGVDRGVKIKRGEDEEANVFKVEGRGEGNA